MPINRTSNNIDWRSTILIARWADLEWKATMEGGSENTRRSYMEHPMVDTDSPPIRRTDKGRIYSRLPTTDRGPRPKCMARKHPRAKYYASIHMRMAYTVSTQGGLQGEKYEAEVSWNS